MEWFNANKLSLNVTKTNYMLFNNHKNVISHTGLIIGADEVTKVHSIKFLGIEIDDKLNWLNHIKRVEKKLSTANFILRNLRYKINQNTALKLYDTLVLPHLIYCNSVWGNACKTYTLNIFRLQKRILRVCSDKKMLTSAALFNQVNKLSFYNINKLQISQIVFKFFYSLNTLPDCIVTLFKKISDVHHFHTRSLDNFCLFTQSCRINTRKASLKVYAPTVWNKIPIFIRQINSISLFKKEYKKYLHTNPLD